MNATRGLTMRQVEYCEQGGTRCPYCRSWDVHPGIKVSEREDGALARQVVCLECNERWFEVYRLKGWEGR